METNRWNLRTKAFIHLGDLESSIQADRILTEWALMVGGGLLRFRQALKFCYLMESRSKSSYFAWGGWRKIKLVSELCGQLYTEQPCLLVSRRASYFPHGLWCADNISIGNCKWNNSKTSIWWWPLYEGGSNTIAAVHFIKTIRSSFLCACKLKNWTEPLHCLRCYWKCPVRKLTPKAVLL